MSVKETGSQRLTPARARVLDRLKMGPLDCSDIDGLAPSKSALKNYIFQLRAMGYAIETIGEPKKSGAWRLV